MTKATHARQYPLFIEQDLDYTDFVTGAVPPVVELPNGAVILPALSSFMVITAGAAASTLDIGFTEPPSTTSGNGIANDIDLATVASTALTFTQKRFVNGGTITFTPTGAGAATTGKYKLLLAYIVEGRGNETFGNKL